MLGRAACPEWSLDPGPALPEALEFVAQLLERAEHLDVRAEPWEFERGAKCGFECRKDPSTLRFAWSGKGRHTSSNASEF